MTDTAIKPLPRVKATGSKFSKKSTQKKSALRRFVSFITGKSSQETNRNKGRQKSTDSTSSGISSNKENTHSDENLDINRITSQDSNKPFGNRPSIRVIKNNNQIPTTGIINNPIQTKRSQSTRGGLQRARTTAGRQTKRSNTINAGKLLKNLSSETSDSSSTGYRSEDKKNHKSQLRKSNSSPGNRKIKRVDESSESSSSSESYTSSDDSVYSSDEYNRKILKPRVKKETEDTDDYDTQSGSASCTVNSKAHEDEEEDEEALQFQLEAIPEADEEPEEKRSNKLKRKDKQIKVDQEIAYKEKMQLYNKSNFNRSPRSGLGKNSRRQFHSFHGHLLPEDYDQIYDEECLLEEALRDKGRSISTDQTQKLSNARDRIKWKRNRDPKAKFDKTNGTVKAIAQKIQAQTETTVEDPYLASQFAKARKFFRSGSQEGQLSKEKSETNWEKDELDDDPLFEPSANLTTRRAGMSQVRKGRISLERKSSYPSTKSATEANVMEKHPKDKKEVIKKETTTETPVKKLSKKELDKRNSNHSSYSRYEAPNIVRSTSRVKQIAMSLHERETTVRKTEAMIANHQPLAENGKESSDVGSIGQPSPTYKRHLSKQNTPKQDDSFIKELLEIARAESQEKQKDINPKEEQKIVTLNQSLSLQISHSSSKDHEGTSLEEFANTVKQDLKDRKPKDFKEAISMASTRLIRKKRLSDDNADGTNDEYEVTGNSDNGSNRSRSASPVKKKELTKTKSAFTKGSNSTINRNRFKSSDYGYQSNVSMRAKMFENVGQDELHSTGSKSKHSTLNNQNSNSSGVYSTSTPEEEDRQFKTKYSKSMNNDKKSKKVVKRVRKSSNNLSLSLKSTSFENAKANFQAKMDISDREFANESSDSVNMSNLHGTSQIITKSRVGSIRDEFNSFSGYSKGGVKSGVCKFGESVDQTTDRKSSILKQRPKIVKKKRPVHKANSDNTENSDESALVNQSNDNNDNNTYQIALKSTTRWSSRKLSNPPKPSSPVLNQSRLGRSKSSYVTDRGAVRKQKVVTETDDFLKKILNDDNIPSTVKDKVRNECWSLFSDEKTSRSVKQCILNSMITKEAKLLRI